jgi:hypothetical protein
MWKTKIKIHMHVAIAGLLLVGCSGDPTGTDSGDPLTDAEVQAILTELAGSFGGVAGVPTLLRMGPETPVALASLSVEPININFSDSAPCESGNIGVDGSIEGDVDEASLTGSFSAHITWTINACVLTVEGTAVTVDHDPNIVFDADFTLDENTVSATGTEKGGFRFTVSDGRSGTCGIDLSFDISVNTSGTSLSSSTTGTVCGRNADAFVAFGG